MKKILILACFFSLIISCNRIEKRPIDKNILATEKIVLDKKEYEHKDYKGITLGFQKDIVYGYTGINFFNSRYEIKDGKLITHGINMTLAAGDPKATKIEHEILDLLRYNKKFEITRESVKLTDKSGKIHEFRIK